MNHKAVSGCNIRKFREQQDMSVQELAEQLRILPGLITSLENGEWGANIETYFRICRIFDITIDQLFVPELITYQTDSDTEIRDAALVLKQAYINNINELLLRSETEEIVAIFEKLRDMVKGRSTDPQEMNPARNEPSPFITSLSSILLTLRGKICQIKKAIRK